MSSQQLELQKVGKWENATLTRWGGSSNKNLIENSDMERQYMVANHFRLIITSSSFHPWTFPKIGVGPQNGWFIHGKLSKREDFGGTPMFGNTHM